MFRTLFLATSISALLAGAGHAQTVGTEVQRDGNLQQRVENGLKSGALSTGEASQLERGDGHIDRMQQNALEDGNFSSSEASRIERAQNRESRRTYALNHNGVTGNPNGASSKRMQADVRRNIDQERRIQQGAQSGSLTNRETARLEGGQASLDHREAAAGSNGHVGPAEQRRIQSADNRQSRRVYRLKHNARAQ